MVVSAGISRGGASGGVLAYASGVDVVGAESGESRALSEHLEPQRTQRNALNFKRM
jgi:hypothetical protein